MPWGEKVEKGRMLWQGEDLLLEQNLLLGGGGFQMPQWGPQSLSTTSTAPSAIPQRSPIRQAGSRRNCVVGAVIWGLGVLGAHTRSACQMLGVEHKFNLSEPQFPLL